MTNRIVVWEKLGSYAARLNKIPVVGFGEHMTSDGYFKLATWADMISPEFEIVFRDNFWIECGILRSDQMMRLRHALSETAAIRSPSGVCQWDICCENALVLNGNFEDVVLLDLEQAVAAPVPHYQLSSVAKTRGFHSGEMTAFLAGYGLSKSDLDEILPALKRLVVLQTMRSVRWAQDRNPSWVERNAVNAKAAIYELLGSELRLGG